MFSKLLKYDFRSLRRFGIPILLALAATAFFGALDVVLFVNVTETLVKYDAFPGREPPFFLTLSAFGTGFGAMFAFLLIGLAVSLMQILIFVDFYKSLVSDEGYLTFTLPVRAKDILNAKLVNAVIWQFIVGLASLVAAGIIFFAAMAAMGFPWGQLALAFQEFLPVLRQLVPYGYIGVELFLLGAASFVNSILLYFGAIFFASVIAHKHKILTAIACIYGVNMVYGFISSVASSILTTVGGLLAFDSVHFAANAMLVPAILLVTGLNIAFYYGIKYMMEKKINLS